MNLIQCISPTKVSTIDTKLALFFLMLISYAQMSNAQEWNLSSDKEGTKIYTRSIAGCDTKEVRVLTTFKTDINTLRNVLADVDNYSDWAYKCKIAKKIKTISNNEFYYYTAYEFPFPAADRDLVIHTRQWRDDATEKVYFHSEAKPAYLPAKDSNVRIEHFVSDWVLTPNIDGTTTVEYKVSTSLGGNIPAWVVNMGITTGPEQGMKSLAGEVRNREKRLASN